MRRFVPLAVVAAVLLLPPAAAQGQEAGDSVAGGFRDLSTDLLILEIDARSDAAGGQPTGTVTWHFGGGLGPTWTGDVTCLSVDGGTAIIGFSGTFTFFSQVSPVAGLIRVVDGGGPDSRQDSFEWAETVGPSGDPPIPGPTDCASYPASFTPSSVVSVNERGDLAVTDAHQPPTSKEQCHNGGWQQLGFGSHHECVRAAEQQARLECVFIRAAHGRPAFRARYGSGVHLRHAMRRCVRERSSS